jgi:hypothetical protein
VGLKYQHRPFRLVPGYGAYVFGEFGVHDGFMSPSSTPSPLPFRLLSLPNEMILMIVQHAFPTLWITGETLYFRAPQSNLPDLLYPSAVQEACCYYQAPAWSSVRHVSLPRLNKVFAAVSICQSIRALAVDTFLATNTFSFPNYPEPLQALALRWLRRQGAAYLPRLRQVVLRIYVFPLSDSRHTASTRLIRRVGSCTGLVNLKIMIHVVGFSVQERANVYANRQLFPQLNAAFRLRNSLPRGTCEVRFL